MENRPDIEVPGGPDDDTPLLLATKRKRVGIVYELIKHGAKLSSVDRVRTLVRFHSRAIISLLRLVTIVCTSLCAIEVEILLISFCRILDMPSISIDRTNAVKRRTKSMPVSKRVFLPLSLDKVRYESSFICSISPSILLGTLNLNDDSILGYDLYSSALAEILSEPSLQTPITVVRDRVPRMLCDDCFYGHPRVSMLNGEVESLLC